MEPTAQISPILLLLGASALVALGILAGWKIPGRKRWFAAAACALPVIALLVAAWNIWQGIREDERRSREIFAAIRFEPELTAEEQKAFQILARSSPRVREGVLRLTFANPTNATLALPRMGILLQSALQLDATGKGREQLWNEIVQPALRRQPPRELVWLAAATASIGGYDSNRVATVLQWLGSLIAGETDSEARSIELGLFAPLVDFASMAQIESAANLLLPELIAEPNPMLVNDRIGWHDPVGTRRVRDMRRLAARLSGESARRFADQAIPAMEGQTNTSRALALAKVLVEVKAQLSTNQIDRALTNLCRQSLVQQTGVTAESTLPIINLVEVLNPEQAARAMELLLEVWRSQPRYSGHSRMTESLKPLVQRLSDEDVARLAERIEAVFPDLVPDYRDRIPDAQIYAWADRAIQRVIDTPNPTRRGSELTRVGPVVARLNTEQADKLAGELWEILLGQQIDDSRRWDEANCLALLAPRLSDEKATWLAEQVVEKMGQPGQLGMSAATSILTPLLGRCDKATLEKTVAIVMKPYDQPQVWSFNSGVEPVAFLRSVQLTPAQMQRVLEPLVVALEQYDDPDIYISPATRLSRLADQMSPEQNERVANRLVFLYTQGPNAFGLSVLTGLATNVTFTPYQAKRIVDILLPLALQCRLPQSEWVAQHTGLFLQRLDPAQTEAAGQLIISTMGRMREQMCTVLDAKCLLPLTNVLQPDQARRLGDQLLQIPVQRGNRPGFASLMVSPPSWGTPQQIAVVSSNYPGFAKMLAAQQVHESFSDWALPAAFVERLEKQRYKYRLEAWSSSLAGMVGKMTEADARVIADQVAARCADQGEWEPVLYDENIPKILQHASDAELNRILQSPFAVGSLRHMTLRACELKTGKSFHGDKWSFAASLAIAGKKSVSH